MGCASSSTSETEKSRNITGNQSKKMTYGSFHNSWDEQESLELYDAYINEENSKPEIINRGVALETIFKKFRIQAKSADFQKTQNIRTVFLNRRQSYHPSRSPSTSHMTVDGNGCKDIWDEHHVLMPCSSRWISKHNKPMWPNIVEHLSALKQKCDRTGASTDDIQNTIEKCTGYSNCDMRCLHMLINQDYTKGERNEFLTTVLSNICGLALNVDRSFDSPPPLLQRDYALAVTMSQLQAASLLACAFFCLFPHRTSKSTIEQYRNYPNPNFYKLYRQGPPNKLEKLKCILHYFHRVSRERPEGQIAFQRFRLKNTDTPSWSASQEPLCNIHITNHQKIEDFPDVLQADFANRYIGGGVLGSGCVQEEIRFSICPEMLVSLLLCERMEANECIYLIGCERYCSYKGYAKSFQFAGNYQDLAPRDELGQKRCQLVAMDALYFSDPLIQYNIGCIDRELLKSYVSFASLEPKEMYQNTIATGHWGCGAFNGDKELKAIIQLMAASQAGVQLIYTSYGDSNFVCSFDSVYSTLKNNNITVGHLYTLLYKYSKTKRDLSVFNYIQKEIFPRK